MLVKQTCNGAARQGGDEFEADVPVDEAEKVVFRNLVFDAEVIEQRLGTGVLSHQNQQASVNGDKKELRPNT